MMRVAVVIKVPPLSRRDIRTKAEEILNAFQPSALKDTPTDIERFYTVALPLRTGMRTGSDDLTEFGSNVLGVTNAKEKTSYVSTHSDSIITIPHSVHPKRTERGKRMHADRRIYSRLAKKHPT